MASVEGKAFSQMHLQELVYIAHGWCLAITGQPLTGDRPEAFEYGPEYRRIADALARSGVQPVKAEIKTDHSSSIISKSDAIHVDAGDLSADERAIMVHFYANYVNRRTSQLATLTRGAGTPWEKTYAGGAGNGRDITHQQIRAQFAGIDAKFGN
ncbi:MAG: type II toxin-antitoxin system antitoxin SocA domain-containing protein [Sphingomicrobium sp.]